MKWDMYQMTVDTMMEVCRRKNLAYGDSFNKSLDKYGPIAGLVRIEDKINRLSNLVLNGGNEHDEAIDDTCIDAANYLLMMATWLLERKDKTGAASQDQPGRQQDAAEFGFSDELIERLR
jgi:hypothetical protein